MAGRPLTAGGTHFAWERIGTTLVRYQTMNHDTLMTREEDQRYANSNSGNRPAALYRKLLQRVREVAQQIDKRVGKVIENQSPQSPGLSLPDCG